MMKWPLSYFGVFGLAMSTVTGSSKLALIAIIYLLILLIINKTLLSRDGYATAGWLSALPIIAFCWTIPSSNFPNGLKSLETYAVAMFVPLLFVKGKFTHAQFLDFLKIYCLAALGVFLFALGAAVYNYLFNVHPYFQSEFFFYTDLALPVANAHPVYLALAGSMACIVAIYVWPKNVYLFSYITFITCMIVLLNARAVLAIHFLLMIASAVHSMVLAKSYKVFALAALACLLASFVWALASNVHSKPNRSFAVDLNQSLSRSKQADISSVDDGITVRLAIARIAVDIIRSNTWLGVGTGNETAVLVKQYRSRGLDYLAEQRFNAHNQYLSFLITFGIIGTSLIILTYVTQGMHILKTRGDFRKIYFLFVFLFLFAMVTESLLYRFHGISLFTFMNTILFLLADTND